MSKRARNKSPEPVPVFTGGNVYGQPDYVVEPNHFLPADAPKKLHEELGAMDGWALEDAPVSTDTKDGS